MSKKHIVRPKDTEHVVNAYLKVIFFNVDELILDEDNANEHDRENIDSIKNSLVLFGQQKPIVVDFNKVVRAGNGTVIAARELGWKQIQGVESSLKDAIELMSYSLADNQSSRLSKFNNKKLAESLMIIENMKTESPITTEKLGFSVKTLNSLYEKYYNSDNKPETAVNTAINLLDNVSKPKDEDLNAVFDSYEPSDDFENISEDSFEKTEILNSEQQENLKKVNEKVIDNENKKKDNEVRSMQLYYKGNQFDEFVNNIEKASKITKINSPSELIFYLLEQFLNNENYKKGSVS